MEDIFLYDEKVHSINTLNGVLNKDNVNFAKRTLLYDVIRPHLELVKVRQEYPQNDISDVKLSIDCVIMNRKRYDRLIKLEQALENMSKDSKKEHLKFPKL